MTGVFAPLLDCGSDVASRMLHAMGVLWRGRISEEEEEDDAENAPMESTRRIRCSFTFVTREHFVQTAGDYHILVHITRSGDSQALRGLRCVFIIFSVMLRCDFALALALGDNCIETFLNTFTRVRG